MEAVFIWTSCFVYIWDEIMDVRVSSIWLEIRVKLVNFKKKYVLEMNCLQ